MEIKSSRRDIRIASSEDGASDSSMAFTFEVAKLLIKPHSPVDDLSVLQTRDRISTHVTVSINIRPTRWQRVSFFLVLNQANRDPILEMRQTGKNNLKKINARH